MSKRACFDLDGVRVQGDPDMSEEAKQVVRDLVMAATVYFTENPPPREDCRWCAVSYEDCSNTPDEDMGRCCDRCRHPIAQQE